MSTSVISLRNISKSFHVGEQDVQIITDITFDVKKGDFLIIFGPSGCGKSTLLHVMLGLEAPTSGKVIFLDKDFYNGTSEDDRSEFRKKSIGMVYQQPNWIKSLSVLENVIFPLLLLGNERESAKQLAETVLKSVGMQDYGSYIPTELSSGQQQKISLARAIVTNPEVIIADEPTGNLDYDSGQELMEHLTRLNKEERTIVMVTHDLEYLKYAKTAVQMFNGQVKAVYNEKDKGKLIQDMKLKRGEGVE